MSTFFVLSNIKRNKKYYQRGDTIELDESSAAQLLEAGVVQDEPIVEAAAPEEESAPPAPEKAKLVIGTTEHEKSGEPSLDGRSSDAAPSEAKDVTPREPSFLDRIFGGKAGPETAAPNVPQESATATPQAQPAQTTADPGASL